MKADLVAKLESAKCGGTSRKTGVAGVTGVAATSATPTKSLKLQQLHQLHLKSDRAPNSAIRGVAEPVAVSTEPDEAEIEERKAMAAGGVPEPYLDAWARLQCQQPIGVGEVAWRQAIVDSGKFLDAWGSLAVEFQWTPGDLFDVPRDGLPGGFVWFLTGEAVRALGPEHAVTEGERIFDRITRGEWINPYAKGEHR